MPLLLVYTLCFLREAIHSAVRVSTGEADEIASQSLCGFCGETSRNLEQPKIVIIIDDLLKTVVIKT